MISKFVFARATAVLGLTFLIACGDEMVVAPSPEAGRPVFELGEGEEAPIDSVVLWPSDAVYAGSFDDDMAGPSMLVAGVVQPNIRIGVVQASTTVHLGATTTWSIRDKANGVLLMTGPASTSATVTLAAVPEAYVYFQVSCGTVAAISTLKAKAESFGYFTLTETIAACTRLLVGRLPTSSTTAQRNAFEAELMARGLAPADGSAFPRTVTIGTQVLYRVTRGATVIQNVNPVVVTAADGGQVLIGPTAATLRRYRGKGEARINSAATLAGINELPMEHYLYGVIPGELGASLYPQVEAQKAQSVVARTYAMAGLGKRASDGYDLRATTDDQVYLGFPFEHPVSNAAVDATAGIVVTHDGRIISTNFFSASGGHTANNEEAFNGAPVAYQRGVPDSERGEAASHVPSLEVFRAHANPTTLRHAREADFESEVPLPTRYRWTYEWTPTEISAVISAWAGRSVGRVLEINVLDRGPSGRVLAIEYVTEAGTFTHAGRDGIRGSLRYYNASGMLSNLWSTLFFVEPVKERGDYTGGFRVFGGGFGHGVGMSQIGAVGMARLGRSYDEILTHYFQGVALEAAY